MSVYHSLFEPNLPRQEVNRFVDRNSWDILNGSFTTKAKYAISTLVTNGHYITGMQTLAYAVSKWKRSDTDLLALVLEQASLTEVQTAALRYVGWNIIKVPLVA